ncbi:MAG TPA: DsrE family protein [Saprospiraceae bacterium]|nr:DsrE family protein [Saprospiraceae bacterium]HNT22662.1 DsrE family protein [Saprospiraceae bacterium]
MKILIIINDPPYGTEKLYNAMRLTHQLVKDHPEIELRVFLMADAATAALTNQVTPNGYYNVERMLKLALSKGVKIKICGSCAEARGINKLPLIEGTELSNMSELAHWVVDSDKVLTF